MLNRQCDINVGAKLITFTLAHTLFHFLVWLPEEKNIRKERKLRGRDRIRNENSMNQHSA